MPTLARKASLAACHADPAAAATALARNARYIAWRREPAGDTPDLLAGSTCQRHRVLHAHLAADPAGGWLALLAVTSAVKGMAHASAGVR